MEADAYASAPAAYVHIPFCSQVCPYCDFAVVAGKDHLVDQYISSVNAEIALDRPWRALSAVFFGGGTPSHLNPRLLGQVLDALRAQHGIAAGAEICLEANPEDFDLAKARALFAEGFNRVSFGAQSFDPGVLAALGRRHQPSQIVSAVDAARRAGFENVSVDLIFGDPAETDASWESTLLQAANLEVNHVSCYALTVELGTPLGRQVRGGAPGPDADAQATRYEMAQALLAQVGFAQYEVSNWGRGGAVCRYNMTVWAQGEYLAYGNGAHGFRGDARYRNLRRLEAYLKAVAGGALPRAGSETVAGWDLELDRLFVGLRRTAGVRHGRGTIALLNSRMGRRLIDAGVIEDRGDRLVVVRPLLTDAVNRAVLDLDPPEPDGFPTQPDIPIT